MFWLINTVFVVLGAGYLVFVLICLVFLMIDLGTLLQLLWMNKLSLKFNLKVMYFVYMFQVVFYLFSLWLSFPVYKEMKIQFYESFAGINSDENDNNQHEEDQNVNNNNEGLDSSEMKKMFNNV